MQNRGNFVLNKAHCLMNIDDADLCVYPKSTREKGKKTTQRNTISQHPIPLQPLKKTGKKFYQGLFLMMLPGLVASCPQIEKENDFSSVYRA